MPGAARRGPGAAIRGLGAAVAGGLAAPPVLATAQCPPEAGEKPELLVAAGWGVLALFLLAGTLVPLLLWRRTRALTRGARFALRGLALLVMLLLWAAGLLVWLGGFVLPC